MISKAEARRWAEEFWRPPWPWNTQPVSASNAVYVDSGSVGDAGFGSSGEETLVGVRNWVVSLQVGTPRGSAVEGGGRECGRCRRVAAQTLLSKRSCVLS